MMITKLSNDFSSLLHLFFFTCTAWSFAFKRRSVFSRRWW